MVIVFHRVAEFKTRKLRFKVGGERLKRHPRGKLLIQRAVSRWNEPTEMVEAGTITMFEKQIQTKAEGCGPNRGKWA